MLRYAEWRGVIASTSPRRRGLAADDLLPRTVGQVSLALALSAYDAWLDHPDASLAALLDDAMSCLRDYLAAE